MPTITHTATARQADTSLKTLGYLEVSRNLRNSPIARGARAHVEWVINKREGWRGYSIPGAGIFLPINCGIKRHATGFDVAVLLTLTGLSLSRGPSEVRISNTDILRHMGLNERNGKNRNKVADAIRFWHHATIIWERWYTPNRKAELRADCYDVLEVERPIVEVGRGRVVLNRDWLKATKGMYAQIPTPLPTNATQLNLCLMVLCKLDWDQLKGGTGQVVYGSRLRITKLLGLNSHKRRSELKKAFAKLKEWFERRGGALSYRRNVPDDGRRIFKYRLPPIKVPARVARKRIVAAKWAAKTRPPSEARPISSAKQAKVWARLFPDER